jgi:hypothetical protein
MPQNARRIRRDDCDEVYDVKRAAMMTMMAGPRAVGLGCFSPVQWLDERSEASVIESKCLATACNNCKR